MLDFFFRRNFQFIAITLASLHGGTSTLAIAALLWSIEAHPLASSARAQTLPEIPQSPQQPPQQPAADSPRSSTAPTTYCPTVQSMPAPAGGQGLESPGPQPLSPTPQGAIVQPPPAVVPPPTPPIPAAPATPPPDLQSPNVIPVAQFPPQVYTLAPGDQIFIDVQPYQNVTGAQALNPQGKIVLPLIGPVDLQGLTLEQATQTLQTGLNEFLVDPRVNVTLVAQRPVNLTITGEVTQPGFYTFPAQTARVTDVLANVGGTTPAADLGSVLVRRPLGDGRFLQQRINIMQPLQAGSPPPRFLLEDGDILIVPKIELTQRQPDNLVARSRLSPPQAVAIRVLGEVTRPGFYNLPPSVNPVQDALVLAGGSTPTADLRAVRVRRILSNGRVSEEIVDLYTPLLTGSAFPDLRLGTGDVVIVPKLTLEEARNYNSTVVFNSTLTAPQPVAITVLGEVSLPGLHVLGPSPNPISTALQTAGGSTPAADLRSVRVRRLLPDGRFSEETVNLLAPLQNGTPFPDLRLGNGDVVIVPTQDLEAAREYDNTLVSNSTLAARQPVSITVLGEVAQPGFHVLAPSPRPIPTALQTAGGATPGADLRSLRVCRVLPNGRVSEEIVDLYTPLQTGQPLPDLRLGNGDLVIVPKLSLNEEGEYNSTLVSESTLAAPLPVNISVLGEVAQPGFYTLPPSPRPVADALLLAGGINSSADLREIRVRRVLENGTVTEENLDLYTPLQTGKPLPDLRLANGDVLFVPKVDSSTDEYYDRFLVSRSTLAQEQILIRILSYPGGGINVVPIRNGATFADIVNTIPLATADLDSIALVRFDPEQGEAVTQEINAKELLMGDLSQNVPLQNNDVIVIGRNLVSKITYSLNTFTQPFRDVLGFLLFFDSLRDSATLLFGPGGDDNDENN